MNPHLSFILPVRNGMPGLETCLRAIRHQAATWSHEIIVLDSASEDDSADCARSLGCRVVAVDPNAFGHGRTRNQGASLARGSLLVFLSQDAIPRAGWLAGLLEALDGDRNLAGVCSRHVAPPTASPSVRRAVNELWPAGKKERYRFRADEQGVPPRWLFFSNSSSAIRRHVWQVHPFPEVRFGEDVAWARRVVRAGFTVGSAPASTVWHAHDEPPWERFGNNVDHMRGMTALQGNLAIPGFFPSLGLALRSAIEDLRYHRRTEAAEGGFSPPSSLPTPLPTSLPALLPVFLRALLWQLAGHLGAWLGARCHRPFLAFLADRVTRQARSDPWNAAEGGNALPDREEENPLFRPPRFRWKTPRWIAALAVLSVLLVILHGRSLDLGFLGDDHVILERASGDLITALRPPRGWFFRPGVFALFWALGPGETSLPQALPFRLLILGLQLLMTLLVLELGRRTSMGFWPSALAAGLYLLYPFHGEGFLWISALTDLVMAVCLLAALRAWIAWSDEGGWLRLGACLLLATLALFTKQTAAVFPFMAAGWEFLSGARSRRPAKKSLSALLLLFLPLLLFFGLRGQASPLFVHGPLSIARSLAAAAALVFLPESHVILEAQAVEAVEAAFVTPAIAFLALGLGLAFLDRRQWLFTLWALAPMALIAVFQGGPQGRYMVAPAAFSALITASFVRALWLWTEGRARGLALASRSLATLVLLLLLFGDVQSWGLRHAHWREADRLARRVLHDALSELRPLARGKRIVLVNVPDSLPEYGPWRAYVFRNGLDDAVERGLRHEGIAPAEVVEALTPASDWSNPFRMTLDEGTEARLRRDERQLLLYYDPWKEDFVLDPTELSYALFEPASRRRRRAPGRLGP